MKLILPLVFSLISLNLSSQTFVEQKDKHLHFAAGAMFGPVGYSYVYLKTKNKKKAIIGGLISATLVGTIKETIDATQPNNRFDFEDLAATALGGITISVTFNLFNKKKHVEIN
jgi:uncharacterized protein YfiM (DUF2279 family)